MSFQSLVQEIFPIKEIISISEKISEYNYSFVANEVTKIDNLSDLFRKFDSHDKVILSVKIYESITVDSENKNFEYFISKLKSELSTLEDEEIIVTFTINKSNENGNINVYDFEEFNKFFGERSSLEILNLLTPLIKKHSTLKFIFLYNLIDEFFSENIYFINPTSNKEILNQPKIDIDKIRINCHFENFSNYPFTANYFRLLSKPKTENNISKKLDLLTFMFYIIGLYDISSIKDNNFYSKINGFKSFEIEKEIDKLDTSSMSEYEKIYDWVYSDKSHVTDKVGLFRNIISIHLVSNSHNIDENVYISINSGYKSYLQNSINKYVEIRSKITDQVNLISQKTNDLAEKYLSNYQKSNFAFISFFISVFLLRVLNTKQIDEIKGVFNKDTTIIFFSLIGISVLYFIFTLITFNSDIKRIKDKYELLKKRNEDLLDKKDIEKILSNDLEFNSDIKYLNNRKKFYTILWIATLLIFIIAVLSLSSYANWETIIINHFH